jgi:hypothetical protein
MLNLFTTSVEFWIKQNSQIYLVSNTSTKEKIIKATKLKNEFTADYGFNNPVKPFLIL